MFQQISQEIELQGGKDLNSSDIDQIKRQFLHQKIKQDQINNEIQRQYKPIELVTVSQAYSSPLNILLYNLNEQIQGS
jgi:hypothetical protein